MNIVKANRLLATVFAAAAFAAISVAHATPIVPEVTYTWTTTNSTATGPKPTASFEVTLSAVQSGKITAFDISNIQFSFPSKTFNNSTVSYIGMDFAAYVNTSTGALVFKDNQEGLSLIAFDGSSINDATTFVSFLFDNPKNSNSVQDQYNYLNNGNPTAFGKGSWTATMPTVTQPTSVPEPGSLALLGVGLAGVAFGRRRKSK